MSLLSQASLVVVPSGYKEDVVYSVKPTDGSGDLTFTRASDGTRVNSAGLVENVPWNLLEQSNTFSTSPWSLVNSTLTSGQSGYDNSSDAWLIQSTGANGRVDQSVSKSGVQTFSVYAKAANSNWIRLRSDYTGANADAYFDLQNGVVGSSYNVITTQIDSVGNGWYRCSVVFNQSITVVRIYTTSANNSAGGSGNSAYIQDAQLNTGSTAKPYFPTTDRQNVPRLTYEGGRPSLLLEPQRTNSALYSEQLDNAVWTKGGVSISTNATTSPDGTQNADLIYPSSSGNYKYVFQLFSLSSNIYTLSVYAKAQNKNVIWLYIEGSSNYGLVYYDLSNGTMSTTAGSLSTPTGTMTAMGNGWYRCTLTLGSNIALSAGSGFGVCDAKGSPYATASGTNGVYFYGAQLEAGSYATSYIPTTSAAVTRVADAAYKTGISSLIGQTEGTLYFQFNGGANDSADYGISLSDGTTNNRIIIYRSSTNTLITNIRTASTTVVQISTSTLTADATHKVAVGYANNDVVFYVNGVQIGTDTSAAIPATDRLLFDNGGGSGAQFYRPLNQLLLFKTRLTNDQLAALTTL